MVAILKSAISQYGISVMPSSHKVKKNKRVKTAIINGKT